VAGAEGQRRGGSRGSPRARPARERGRAWTPALRSDDARHRPPDRLRRRGGAQPSGRLLVEPGLRRLASGFGRGTGG
jgi:hypothetical protein